MIMAYISPHVSIQSYYSYGYEMYGKYFKNNFFPFSMVVGFVGYNVEKLIRGKYIPVDNIAEIIKTIETKNEINLGNEFTIPFYFLQDIVFNKDFLPFHANGLKFTAYKTDDSEYESTFYSIGGGFVVKEERANAIKKEIIKCAFPFPESSGRCLPAI